MNNCFYVCNGEKLYNLEDLLNELQVIDDESFSHHVNSEKNDFCNWILNEIKDKVLFKKLSDVKDRQKMIEIIDKRVNNDAKKKKSLISQIKEALSND